MKSLAAIASLLFATTFPAVAAEGVPAREPLQLQAKSALASSASTHQNAPFVTPLQAAAPQLDLVVPTQPRERSPSSCKRDVALCYDGDTGHIVFKPARNLMPDVPGLQRENITLKRDRIVFRYTF